MRAAAVLSIPLLALLSGCLADRPATAPPPTAVPTAAVTEVVAALLFLGVWAFTDWGAGLALTVTLPVMLGFAYWFLPHAMALWVAVEYLTDRGNREPWAS